ncbi:MAG: DUF4189 domain-containing protein [Pseudomonadota bacterium]
MIRAAVIWGFVALPATALAVHAESFLSLAMDAGAGVHNFATADSAAEAQTSALKACKELAGGCEIVLTRANLCASLAYDYSNGGFGVGTDVDADVAQSNAVPICTSYGNPNCQIVETICAK